MSRSTISTFELFQMFPDDESARAYFEARRWPDGAICPACNEATRIGARKGGFYRCNRCLADFTVRTGTIFERSKVPLHKWLAALVLIHERPEIPSEELARELGGLTQKTGWLILERVRAALHSTFEKRMSDRNRRIVADFPAYSVTRDGAIWTRYRAGRGGRIGYEWRPLSPALNVDGYRIVQLRDDGELRYARVARLVCEAFHGPAPEGHEARHLDGSRTNDAASNLAWGTSAENRADASSHGTVPAGEDHPNATLTDDQIAEIRALRGKLKQSEIAERFGTTQAYVSKIQRGANRAAIGRRLTYAELIA